MSTMSECVGASVPHEITHEGKTYKISHVTQEVKSLFEKKLFAQARDAAVMLRECMTADEYRQQLKLLNDDYISGKYALESHRALETLQTPKGCLLLVSLLMGLPEMEALKILSARRDELAATLEIVLKESFPQQEGEEAGEATPTFRGRTREAGCEGEGAVGHAHDGVPPAALGN